ncbi:disease resistance protein RPM1-like [Camellia sinensis]|uniref:Disease resistance protein RPM1-like n=1 Tax=Camellia sinensis var. sinensis TaxID=542762 RepID=A0A4V3WMI5_CAMSN|nr:disease resistance protein RPM1-like [Camellia sinensis]THG08777.1 hypothetical protein TEA_016926 [Camellia sinensis var. sinensis]
MAESAVTFLLKKLIAALHHEEVKLLRGVWGEVTYIKDELERMTAFLNVADQASHESDEELKVWVKQVRDVVYDTNDVLDEFKLHVENHHHRQQGFFRSFLNFFHSILNLKARHRIASRMKHIKTRVRNISEGRQRYRYKCNIVEEGSTSSTVSNSTWHDCRGDALLVEEAELVGIDKRKKQLIEHLLEDEPELKIISVVGMGGMGKTTLVRKIYEDSKVKRHFQTHVWITVSQTFVVEEFLKDIIVQLFAEIKQPVPQRINDMGSHDLKMQINEFLSQKRYVIVLDDIWRIDACKALKYALPNCQCGSRVMLTTRIADIASTTSTIFDGSVTYPLEPLSREESWNLFYRKTFKADTCPPHLNEISRRILRRCEGLPLAIAAISGLLATKDKGYLKPCFLYFSIFPNNYFIKRMRLIRLWVAEGFVQVREGQMPEEIAESYLNELVNRSLVQIATTTRNGRVSTCRIHDLLREISLSKSRELNFVTIANRNNTQWLERIRRLSIHKTCRNVEKGKRLSHLRSLFTFGVADMPSKLPISTLLTGVPRLLKVLDLQGAPLESLPNEIFELYLLRYLSLRKTRVKKIPSSIGRLVNLETLDLKHASVTELPVEILKLQKLRHLLVYRYVKRSSPFHSTYGFKPPLGMGDLQSLQKLCFVEANQSSDILNEVGKLTQLRKLGITKLRREDGGHCAPPLKTFATFVH